MHKLTVNHMFRADSKGMGIVMNMFCSIRNARIMTTPCGLHSSASNIAKAIDTIAGAASKLLSVMWEGVDQVLEGVAEVQTIPLGTRGHFWRHRCTVNM